MQQDDFGKQLEYWIAKATSGLCDEVRPRLKAEFTAHYETAYIEELEAGTSAEKAHEAAMEQLGNARNVRRQLKRIHLTRWKTNWLLEQIYPKNRVFSAIGRIASFYILFINPYFLLTEHLSHAELWGIRCAHCLIATYFIYCDIRLRKVYEQLGAKSASRLLLHQFIALNMALLIILFLINSAKPGWDLLDLGCLLIAACIYYIPWNIYRKLKDDTMIEQ